MDEQARGAIVGFSFGAWIGILLAAADHRLKAAALTAVAPRMSQIWRVSPNPEIVRIRASLPEGTLARYADATRSIDAIEHLGRCTDCRLLFQFGSGDEFVTEQDIQSFCRFAGGDNSLRIYDSGSHLDMFLNADVRLDRLVWLQAQLAP